MRFCTRKSNSIEISEEDLPLYLEGPIFLYFSQSFTISPNRPNPSMRADTDFRVPSMCTLAMLEGTAWPWTILMAAVVGHRVPYKY